MPSPTGADRRQLSSSRLWILSFISPDCFSLLVACQMGDGGWRCLPYLPSGKLTNKWWFIVDLTIKNGGSFHGSWDGNGWKWMEMDIPSGKLTVCSWTWPSRNSWFTHEKWWFSIAMLNYQRVPYIRPQFQGISPENMTRNMVTYLHGWDPEVPMETMEVSWIPGDSYKKIL